MTEQITNKWISGFWRRIGAFAIDSLVLGIVGIGLGGFLEEQFVQLGGWGRFVGFLIALPYFGILNSRISDGQTIGKKALNIRVVNANNQTIDLSRSFIRYSILGVPFFLNGAQVTNDAVASFWMVPISLIIFGGLISAGYLYCFNRVTRQTLHDLVVGTYVVNVDAERHGIGSVWRPHLLVVGTFFLLGALAPIFTSSLARSEPFKELLAVQAALGAYPSVTFAAVSSGTTTNYSTSEETRTTTHLSARAFLNNNSVSDADFAKELARVVARKHSASRQVDVIQIVLTYGYDIGIASYWRNHTHSFRPEDLTDDV